MDVHPVAEKIESILKEKNCWYERFLHEPVRTSEEAAALRPGYTLAQGAKALIVRIKQGGIKRFVMLVLPGDRRFDMKKTKEALSAKDIRFATEEEVGKITGGVLPGGVPPWGNLFNLPVYVDAHLFENESIIFNAGDRRVSIAMKSGNYRESVQPTEMNLL